MLNSKGVGRLLAAGGFYNGNIEGFKRTADLLGGDAPAGFEQMLNEKTKGVAIAAVSAGAALGVGRVGAAREMEQLEKLVKVEKAAPTVTAELKVNGRTFFDTNQTARASELADANKPTLISERIARKHAKAVKKIFTKGLPEPNPIPNGNMADAHAEIGAIQQAHEAGVVKGADMHITVAGRNVCGYCKGDIPAMGNAAEIRSMTIDATDEFGKQRLYRWEAGMVSLERTK